MKLACRKISLNNDEAVQQLPAAPNGLRSWTTTTSKKVWRVCWRWPAHLQPLWIYKWIPDPSACFAMSGVLVLTKCFFAMPSTVLSLDIPWQFASNHGISSKLPYSDMNSPPISWSCSGFMIYSSNSTDIKPSHPQSIIQWLWIAKGQVLNAERFACFEHFWGPQIWRKKKRKNGWFSTKQNRAAHWYCAHLCRRV